MKCPICNKGKLVRKKVKEYVFGELIGEFPADVCNHCGESFMDEAVVKQIEDIAKKKGLFGLEKKTKISKSGNSLAVRIPKKISEYLKLKKDTEVYIHPERNKLVIETI